MQYEYEIKFFIFGKPFKTTILAENEQAAQDKLNDFIQSKTSISAIQKQETELNDLVDQLHKLFSFKKRS